jgi:tetratricopeptide (TPR) repeat protein
MLAPVLWLLGFPEQSARLSEQGLASARAGGHFNTIAYAIYFGALTPALFRLDVEAIARHTRALTTIAEEQGAAFYVAAAAMADGLTQIERGESEEGLARFARAREDWRATGSRFHDALFAAVLANLHLRGGRLGEGLTAIDEALALAQESGELSWDAEIHRLRGELLLAASGRGETEAPGASRGASPRRCVRRSSQRKAAATSFSDSTALQLLLEVRDDTGSGPDRREDYTPRSESLAAPRLAQPPGGGYQPSPVPLDATGEVHWVRDDAGLAGR